jgi:hypothetical protein
MTFKGLTRLFYTLYFMKPRQILYQLWYRIKSLRLKINDYKVDYVPPYHPLDFQLTRCLILSGNKYTKSNCFTFLNLSKDFNSDIDWNFMLYGKLWNYNLQYFDFLLDESVDLMERKHLLDQFSSELMCGRVKLEPYPASLRIINTIIFISENKYDDEQIIKCLHTQVNYLKKNLEYHILGNHLLENVFALFIAANFFKKPELLKNSSRLLKTQLDKQILDDGAHFECSIMYHSIILSKLLICLEVAEKQQSFDLELLRSKAGKMFGWMNNYCFPDSSWALMKDAALHIAPATLLLNNIGQKLNIDFHSDELGDSGYAKLKGRDWELIVNVGEMQPKFQPGHGHSDILSFCLWRANEQIVVDPGTSTYTNSERRNLERSTPAHNTVSIENTNQSDVWGSFRVASRAKCKLLHKSSTEIVAEVRYKENIHRRHFLKTEEGLKILDTVITKSKTDMPASASILFGNPYDFVNNKNILSSRSFTFYSSCSFDISSAEYATEFNHLITTKKITIPFTNSLQTGFTFK